MEVAVGVFHNRVQALRALERLIGAGVSATHLVVLTPDAADSEVASVPTDDAEPPGMGAAVGGVAGGAAGAFGAGVLGPVASAAIPGIGPVVGVGLGAMALLGALGAAVGAVAGHALEHTLSEGLPREELDVYRDLLARGRTVLAVQSDAAHVAEARRLLEAEGGAVDLAKERRAGASS